MNSSNGHNDDLAREFNEDCFRQLEKAKFQDRIAIIGSGPSSPIIAPLKELISQLTISCAVPPQGPEEYFWNFCERAHDANQDAYFDVIKGCYDDAPHLDVLVYKQLLNINFKSYVTLNYDYLLPSAFKEYHGESYRELFSVYPPRIVKPEEKKPKVALPGELLHKRRLVAIHGFCDDKNPNWPREVILKRSDYNKHYFRPETNQYLCGWWTNLLTLHPCVFIGTSLEEPGLCKVVNDLMNDKNTFFLDHDHIHLKDVWQSTDAPYYAQPQKSLNVFRQIRFDPINKRFKGLINVLSKFSNIDAGNPSPGTYAPDEISVTDKFPFNK
jgi:hypothetical protein